MKTFTLDEIKAAFRKVFEGSGEMYFGNSPADRARGYQPTIDIRWEEMQDALGITPDAPASEAPPALRETALLLAHRRAEAIADPRERHTARSRLFCSWSSPEKAVERGARIDGDDVVWPDGERWPKGPGR